MPEWENEQNLNFKAKTYAIFNFMKMFLLLLFVVLAPIVSQSQPTNQVSTGEAKQVPSNATMEQVRLLENEVQIQKEFRADILTTVYFCLGTIIVVLIAMIGFGWYQNVRAYERDKEAMRQALSKTIDTMMAEATQKLAKESAEDIKKIDAKAAELFANVYQNLNDLDLSLRTEIFSSSHGEIKTSYLDFLTFLYKIELHLGKASPGIIDDALSQLLNYLKNPKYKDSIGMCRTRLLALPEKISAGHKGAADRLRELLAQSLEQEHDDARKTV